MMARAVAKRKPLKVHQPTFEKWDYAIKRLNSAAKLSGYKIDTVAAADAVQQAILLCDEVQTELGRAVVKKKADALNKLFDKLAFELRSKETQRAMNDMVAEKKLADFLSVSAAEPNLGEAMLKAVESMKKPFEEWLSRYGKSRGGRPVQTARQALLYCLIKDYEEIFSTPLWDGGELRLRTLATHIFPACNVSTNGLEEAVGRAFKEFPSWALWDGLPTLQPNNQGWLERWHENVPDDPEPPIPAAKPGTKK
jgi:hypothetical protein